MTISRFKKDIVLWSLLILVFLASRLVNLTAIPIFTDEAIYLHWSQVMANDANFRYLPLTDGKPPLFMWTTSVVMKVLPDLDPLVAGRLVSIVSGLSAIIGIFFTSFQLFPSRRISYLASILYIVTPFTFFYDRFGLADSMLAMWGVWSLGLGILLVKKIRLDLAIILGVVIGLGLLTKTPAQFFLLFLLPLLVLFDFRQISWPQRLIKLLILYFVVFVVSRAIYSVILLLPQAYVVALKNTEFVVSVSDFVRNPFRYFWGNATALFRWELAYLTLPIAVLVVLGARKKIILVCLFLIHFLFMAFFNKVIYPRYLLTFTPLLLILAATGLGQLVTAVKNKLVLILLLSLFIAAPIVLDYQIVTDPARAPIADNDSEQYLNSWPAGWGINNVREFFKNESLKYSQITLGTEGTFGLMPYALDIYHREYPNLEIKSYWPEPGDLPEEIRLDAQSHPTYYLIYQREKTPQYDGKMELVAKYQQGKSNHFLKLYRISP